MLLPSFFSVILGYCFQKQIHTKNSNPFAYSILEALP